MGKTSSKKINFDYHSILSYLAQERVTPRTGNVIYFDFDGWREARELADKIAARGLPYTADGLGPTYREPNGGGGAHAAENPAVEFLRDFHGDAPWHLVAIKTGDAKAGVKGDIKAASFSDEKREARATEWIERWNRQGYNLYFTPNPLRHKGMARKANKDDVAAAAWLWSDIDPPKGATAEQVEQWRDEQLSDFAAGRPDGLPPVTWHIDSGRGFWRFYRLDEPIKVDGPDGAQTALVESYGRGIEQTFGSAADACRNIDRIARLPGTINHKTGRRAAVLEHHPDRVYRLTDFPQAEEAQPEPPKEPPPPPPGDEPKPFDIDALPSDLRQTILEGNYEKFKNDRSKAVFYVVSALIREGVAEADIVSVLLNRAFKISEHIYDQKESPEKYAKRQFKRAWDKGARPERRSNKPTIQISTDLDTDLRACVKALVDSPHVEIYQRGGALVMRGVVKGKNHSGEDVNDDAIISHCTESLRVALAEAANFEKRNSKGAFVKCYPPIELAAALAKTTTFVEGFPVLRGLTSIPTIRVDGSILDKPGYDTATGLYYDPKGIDYDVPHNPTMGDAEAALQELEALIDKFPFVDKASRSVALARILSGVGRNAMKIAPMFGYTAPSPRTGKSLLNDTATMITDGHEAPVISYSSSPEERQKQLITALRSGARTITLDNLPNGEVLEGELICQIISQERIVIRPMGQNEKDITLPNNAIVVANGNNLAFAADLTERLNLCELDAKMEFPGERKFDFDPVEMVRANRPKFVRVCLTILRAHALAGYPKSEELPPMSRFEDFTKIIRAALVWLGRADPCESMEKIRRQDPHRAALLAIMEEWKAAFGNRFVTVADVIRKAEEMARDESHHNSWGSLTITKYGNPTFLNALAEVATKDGKSISAKSLGHWVKSKCGIVINGMRLMEKGYKNTKVAKKFALVSTNDDVEKMEDYVATAEVAEDAPM